MKHPSHYDTDEATSKRMGRVKLKHNQAEVLLAKELWHHGYRYRLNYKALPGSPDIAVLRYRVAIFVDGEFWHGKDWEKHKSRLQRNREYWIEKIEENMARDYRVDRELCAIGWIPLHFWTKDVLKHLDECLKTILEVIFDRMISD